jgi:hypothetical protein
MESSSLRERKVPRLGQPVDLLLQLHDLVAGLAQRLRQTLVLGRHRRQRPLGVREAQLEAAGVRRAVAQSAAQVGDLRLEEADLSIELLTAAAASAL